MLVKSSKKITALTVIVSLFNCDIGMFAINTLVFQVWFLLSSSRKIFSFL